MMATGEKDLNRGAAECPYWDGAVSKIGLAKQEDVSNKKLEHIWSFFSVVSALYLLLSVLSSPALSLSCRCEVAAISSL